MDKNLTFLGVDSVFNNGYIGFKNPNATANTYDSCIYEGSTSGSTDYTNAGGILMFDSNKAVFNCLIQTRYYNDTFVTNPPCKKVGNATETHSKILSKYQSNTNRGDCNIFLQFN